MRFENFIVEKREWRLLKIVFCGVLMHLVLINVVSAEETQGSDLLGVTAIFQLHNFTGSGANQSQDELLTYSDTGNAKTLTRYRIERGKFVKISQGKALSRLCAATPYLSGNRKYLLLGYCGAYGSTSDPILLVRSTIELDESQIVFQQNTERPEINHLSQVGADVLINYFSSKYETNTEIFEPGNDVLFRTHRPIGKIRMGTSVVAVDEGVLIGRPYGDTLGQDGDVLLFEGSEKKLLPSYRGVSSMSLLPGNKPAVLIADGWHQNYGSFAQGRLSQLRKNEADKRYALELLDVLPNEPRITKIVPFSHGNKDYVLASSDKRIYLYSVAEDWKRQQVYELKEEIPFFQFVFLGVQAGKAQVAVLAKALQLLEVPLGNS